MQIPPFTFIVIGGKQNSLIKIEQFKKESVMIRKKELRADAIEKELKPSF